MRRLHLFELHDSPFCPSAIRNGLTDFLEAATDAFDTYRAVRPQIEELLASSGHDQVIDLCSGAGGPWVHWLKKGLIRANVTLTDKYPNLRAYRQIAKSGISGLHYRTEPVDATAVPAELAGLRTIFTAFHHFPPQKARAIIADAVSKQQPIAIFELTYRCTRAVSAMLLSPIGVWILTAKMRNTGWRKLLLTYLVPAIPLCVLVDGVLSCFRTYSLAELREMASGVTYTWSVGQLNGRGGPVTYMLGCPKVKPKPVEQQFNSLSINA